MFICMINVPERPEHSRISYRCPGWVADDLLNVHCPGILTVLSVRSPGVIGNTLRVKSPPPEVAI